MSTTSLTRVEKISRQNDLGIRTTRSFSAIGSIPSGASHSNCQFSNATGSRTSPFAFYASISAITLCISSRRRSSSSRGVSSLALTSCGSRTAKIPYFLAGLTFLPKTLVPRVDAANARQTAEPKKIPIPAEAKIIPATCPTAMPTVVLAATATSTGGVYAESDDESDTSIVWDAAPY